jgi:hypothetical protein
MSKRSAQESCARQSKKLKFIDDEAEVEGEFSEDEKVNIDEEEEDKDFIDEKYDFMDSPYSRMRLQNEKDKEEEEKLMAYIEEGFGNQEEKKEVFSDVEVEEKKEEEKDNEFKLPDFRKESVSLINIHKYLTYVSQMQVDDLKKEIQKYEEWRQSLNMDNTDNIVSAVFCLFPGKSSFSMAEIQSFGNYYESRIDILGIQLTELKDKMSSEDFKKSEKTLFQLRALFCNLYNIRKSIAQVHLVQNAAFVPCFYVEEGIIDEEEKESLSAFQKAVAIVGDDFRNRRLRHNKEVLFTPDFIDGRFVYSFSKLENTVEEHIRSLADAKLEHQKYYLHLTKTPSLITQVADYFVNSKKNFDLPFLKHDRKYFRYLDCVYDAERCMVLDFNEIKEDIVCIRSFKTSVPTRLENILQAPFFLWNIDPRRYELNDKQRIRLQEEMVEENDWYAAFKRTCPNFFRILEYQFVEMPDILHKVEEYHYYDAQIQIRFFCAFFGRIFFPIKSRDDWEKALTVIGVGGSGKSILCDVIKQIIGIDNCAIFSNDMEKTFGISIILNKLVWLISEIRDYCKMAPSDMLSLITGEDLGMREKNKTPYSYMSKAQGAIFGNEWPNNIVDKGRSLKRRLAFNKFNRYVENSEKDDSIRRNILEKEVSGILFFTSIAYNSLLKFMKSHNIKNISNVWHYSFDENLKEIDKRTNPLNDFFESAYVHVHYYRPCDREIKSKDDYESKRIRITQTCCVRLSVLRNAIQTFMNEQRKKWVYDENYLKDVLHTFKSFLTAPKRIRVKAGEDGYVTEPLVVGVRLTAAWKQKFNSNVNNMPSYVVAAPEENEEEDIDEDMKTFSTDSRRQAPPLPPYLHKDFKETYDKEEKIMPNISIWDTYNVYLNDMNSKVNVSVPEDWEEGPCLNICIENLQNCFDSKGRCKDENKDIAFFAYRQCFKKLVAKRCSSNFTQDKVGFKKLVQKFRKLEKFVHSECSF